jgi:hypothetical protein
MANRDNPHGLQFVGTQHGGACILQHFAKAVGYGTAMFINDVVNRVADGSIQSGGTPGTTLITGVNLNYGAASLATEHDVIVDPFAIFEAQDNNDTDGIAAADLGLNCNIEYNAGSTSTLISGHELDESTADVTSTLDVHLRKLLPVPDNAHSSWARIEISINKHRYATGVAGV